MIEEKKVGIYTYLGGLRSSAQAHKAVWRIRDTGSIRKVHNKHRDWDEELFIEEPVFEVFYPVPDGKGSHIFKWLPVEDILKREGKEIWGVVYAPYISGHYDSAFPLETQGKGSDRIEFYGILEEA